MPSQADRDRFLREIDKRYREFLQFVASASGNRLKLRTGAQLANRMKLAHIDDDQGARDNAKKRAEMLHIMFRDVDREKTADAPEKT